MGDFHAIVLGGGCAGMLAAKVLADSFSHVTLIERFDDFLCADKATIKNVRRGIPQAHHQHVLLQGGQQIFEQFFPGLFTEMHAQGCQKIDWAQDIKWYGPFGAYPQYPSNIKTVVFSRVFLDKFMIARIKKIVNIRIVIGAAVQLMLNNTNTKVIGVLVKKTDNSFIKIEGDLVVDARGRRSDITKFLNQHHFFTPPSTKVMNQLGYATRIFHLRHQDLKPFKQFYLQVRPGIVNRGLVVSPIENNCVLVTLVGAGDDQPSQNDAEFLAILKQLANDDLKSYFHNAVPVKETHIFRNMHNLHRHFGKMQRWPKGLIIVGDAVCILNPVYGQGMTLAAKQTMLLKTQCEIIKNNPAFADYEWEHQFQKKVDKILQLPWSMSTSEDQRDSPSQHLPRHLRIMHWYLDRVLQAAVKNKDVHHLFIQIQHMVRNPLALLMPSTMCKLFLGN